MYSIWFAFNRTVSSKGSCVWRQSRVPAKKYNVAAEWSQNTFIYSIQVLLGGENAFFPFYLFQTAK